MRDHDAGTSATRATGAKSVEKLKGSLYKLSLIAFADVPTSSV